MAVIEDRLFCVYKHTRLDTNEIFYIGIGDLKRPYSKTRSKEWKAIIENTKYTIEIIQDNLSLKDAYDLEILLITLIGRQDKKSGPLINKTNGGGGTKGRVITKPSHNKGKPMSKEQKSKIGIANKISQLGKKHSNITKQKMREKKSNLILNTCTGIFYYGCKKAGIANSIKEKTLWNKLTGISRNNTNLIYI